MIRLIREEEPSKPSTRLSIHESLASSAALRHIEPRKLMALLRGELDWVVMKCLEKRRDRRYESANGLGRDIQRYLANEPVEARPPSAGYRMQKFIRRNKGIVIAASLVLLTLMGGIVGTGFGMMQAENRRVEAEEARGREAAQRWIAEDNEREAIKAEQEALAAADQEREAKEEAERNLAFATKGNEILGSVFTELNPKSDYQTVGELSEALLRNLHKAVAELDGSAIGDPLVVAQMQATLGFSLLGLGAYDSAVQVLEKARSTMLAQLGPEHEATLTTMNVLGMAYRYSGKLRLALPLCEETFKANRNIFGLEHPNTIASMSNLAETYRAGAEYQKAIPLFEEVLRLRKEMPFPNDLKILSTMNNLAMTYQDVRDQERAIPLFKETLERKKVLLGAEHYETLATMNNLATAYGDCENWEDALPLFEEALTILKAKLGSEHPTTLVTMMNLSQAYRVAKKLDLALPMMEQTLKLMKVKLGPHHPDTLFGMNNLATGYWSAKRLDKSIPLFEEVLELQEEKLGRDHLETLVTMANLGVNYLDAGRLEEAIPLLEEAHRASKKYVALRWVAKTLLRAYLAANESIEIANLLEELLPDIRMQLPKGSPQIAGYLALFGKSLVDQKKYFEAEPLLRECLVIREQTRPDDWTTYNTYSLLGGAMLGQKKYAAAEPLLLKGYEGMKTRDQTIPPQAQTRLTEARDRLIALYTHWHAVEPDQGYDVKAAQWQQKRDEHDSDSAAEKPADSTEKESG